MTMKRRIEKLEHRAAPPTPPVAFVLLEPPPGLSREEHRKWMEEQAGDGPVFTLDLQAASLARLHE